MHRLEFLFKHIKSGNILDVGNLAKRGTIHEKIIKSFPNATVYGLDIIDQKTLGLSFANQKVGSFEAMDYPNDFFDTIYLGEVIEHTWQPKDLLDQCFRFLKPGGKLILDTPNVYSLSRMLIFLLRGKDIILDNPEHKIFFSRTMLENMLEKSGFRLIELTSEINFVTRRLKFSLPNFGSFKYLGECLMVLAEKK